MGLLLLLAVAGFAQVLTVIPTTFSGLTANAEPFGITAGPDGALWFTELVGNRIGRITTGEAVSEFPSGLPPGNIPEQIVTGLMGRCGLPAESCTARILSCGSAW